MHSMQALMPFIAACALATALLVPLRDGRRGRRATVYGRAAVTASFPPVARDPVDAEPVVTDDVDHAAAHDAVIESDSPEARAAVESEDLDVQTVAGAASGRDTQPGSSSHRGLARFFDGRVSAFLATTLRGTIFDSGERASVRNSDLDADVTDDAQHLAAALATYRSSRDEAADDDARRFADAISAYDASHDNEGRRDGDGSDTGRDGDDGGDARRTAGTMPTSVETQTDDGRDVRDDDHTRRIAGTISTSVEAPADVVALSASPSAVAYPPHVRRERQIPDDVSGERTSDDDATVMPNPMEPDSRANFAGAIARITSSVEREDRFVRSPRTWSVPPTRMPLRPIVTPEWPRLLPLPFTDASRETRHAVLARRFNAEDSAYEPALCAAFREEDARGRILVLRALGALQGRTSLAVLVGALSDGTDDERSTALDSLAMRGERNALAGALTDRIDAIAARAALAFVDSGDRSDYERMLGPLVDRARLETLLGLLAAVLP